MRKFSSQQLMQYLYGEASPILKMAIEQALTSNEELQNTLKQLQQPKNVLNEVKKKNLSPSKKTIDAIMEYAKQTTPKKKSV